MQYSADQLNTVQYCCFSGNFLMHRTVLWIVWGKVTADWC